MKNKAKDGELDHPKLTTLNTWRSHIKMKILDMTSGNLDISCESKFKELGRFFSGYVKKLKAMGKADIDHYDGKPDIIILGRNLDLKEP